MVSNNFACNGETTDNIPRVIVVSSVLKKFGGGGVPNYAILGKQSGAKGTFPKWKVPLYIFIVFKTIKRFVN